MGRFTQNKRPLAITTPLGTDALLLEGLRGTEGLSELFHFQLELLAEHPADFAKVLGQNATVAIALPNGSKRFINGIISRFSQGPQVPGPEGKTTFIRYRAELVPDLWLLGRRVQSRVFQQQTVIEILTQVLRGDWQLDLQLKTVGNYLPRNFCVQYEESDLAFVSRLMEHEGIFYYFTHTSESHTLVLADSSSAAATDLTPSKLRYTGVVGQLEDVPRIWEWEKSQEIQPCKHTLWDYNFQMPKNNLSASASVVDTVKVGQVSHSLGGNTLLEVQDGDAAFAHWSDGINSSGGEQAANLEQMFQNNQRLAKVRAQRLAVESLNIRGTGDCGSFLPGFLFTLERHFDGDDTYLLTRVEHSASLRGVYTGSENPSTYYENHFQCLPKVLPYRSARVTPRPRVEGTLSALVIGPTVDEAYCDKYGRVKVQFHWGAPGKAIAGDTCWLRVVQPWAGQTWGMLTLPRVGQEVAVGFYHGDPDQPHILGSNYNAEQMPPYLLPSEWRKSGHVSSSGSSVEQYHELRMDDTPGSELFLLHSEKDMSMSSEHNHVIDVANGHGITVGNVMTVAVGPKSTGGAGSGSGAGDFESLTVTGAAGITWTIDNETTYNLGNQALIVKGSDSEVVFGAYSEFIAGAYSTGIVGANTALIVGLNTGVNIGGTIAVSMPFGLTITKGWTLKSDTAGAYELHNGFHIRSVDGVEAKTITGDSVYTVQGMRTLSTEGAFINLVAGDMSNDVSGIRMDTTALEHMIISGELLMLKCDASNIVMTPASITLACGASSITLTPGSILMESPVIFLKGAGGAAAVELTSDGVALQGPEVLISGEISQF